VLPKGTVTTLIKRAIIGLTGTGTIVEEVTFDNMLLPECSRSLRINDQFRCFVMDNMSLYDVIFSHDFLSAIGIDVLHSSNEVEWLGIHIPFHHWDASKNPFDLITECLEMLAADLEELEAPSILDAKYDAVNPTEMLCNKSTLQWSSVAI
jgi:hypothetical protein